MVPPLVLLERVMPCSVVGCSESRERRREQPHFWQSIGAKASEPAYALQIAQHRTSKKVYASAKMGETS